eukprot:762559-Hanusia_phi.AAC.1
MPHWYLVHLLNVNDQQYHQLFGALDVQFQPDFTCCSDFPTAAIHPFRRNVSCIVKSSHETQPKLPRSCKNARVSIMKLEGSLQIFAETIMQLKNEENITQQADWEESFQLVNEDDGERLREFMYTNSDSEDDEDDDADDDEDDDEDDDDDDDDNDDDDNAW